MGKFTFFQKLSCRPTVKGVLNVHIIPHTHAELGYTKTFDNHFTGRDDFYDKSNINMKRILDYVISELWADTERRFAFSDLPYLYKWWTIRDGTVKRMVYQLIRQGRLQIIGGGWSMTDESTATYQAIIDHFTYTLRKVNATFLDCARPAVTWQSDVLGHTNEFASLMAQMGFDGHFINPISLDDELERMRSKRLEFIWRGSPDLGASSEIFTHKLFDGYWSPPGFCFGGQCNDPLIVESNTAFNNVEERVKLFVEAMQYRQGPHYASKHLLVMMGQRFGYYDAPLWFQNIDKLIRNVNNYVGSNDKNMILYYSTPACYLRAVHESNTSFTVETDDFVPIAYDRNTHFSGIFTSRPTVKYAARVGNVFLQITKQLQVLARLGNNEKFFEDFHWIMGALQDHTILTGGTRPFVRDYYIDKIYKTLEQSDLIVRDGLKKLMKTRRMPYKRCLFNISYCEYTNRNNYHIVIYNPLAWNVTLPVRLPVNDDRYTVFLPNLKKVESVIMKIPQSIQAIPYKRNVTYDRELVFLAEDLPGLGYRSYYIQKITRVRRSVYTDDKFTKIKKKHVGSNNSDDSSTNNGIKPDKIEESHKHKVKNHHEKVHFINSDDQFTKTGKKNYENVDSDDNLRNNKVKNDKVEENHNYKVKNHHKEMHPIRYDDTFTKVRKKNYDSDDNSSNNRVENDEICISNVHLSNNKDKKDEFDHSDDHSSNNKAKNEKSDDNHEHEDKNHQIMLRSFNSKDHFTRDRAKNEGLDNINDHINDVNGKNYKMRDRISRKIRSIYFKDHYFGKNGRFDDINDHLRDDREKKYEYIRLHDVRNLNRKVKQDINLFKEPNVTRIIRFKKNAKPNEDLKRIFESIHNDEDNFELDIVFGGAREKRNKNDTNKYTTTFNLNKPNKDFDSEYGHGNEKHDDDVTEYNLDSIIEYSSKLDNNTIKNDLEYSKKDAKTNIENEKYVKNKNRNILKGLKRCNCKIGRLKRDNIEKNSEETNDTIDETFGNKTLRFIHFKQDEEHEQNATKLIKRETKDHKQIKQIKLEIRNLNHKIKEIKKLKVKDPKEDEIKYLIREIKDLKREILDITKRNTNDTRPERSLFKKIRNAKKKYLRRQTNNLKIDDESLLNNDHHYDDDEYSDDDYDLDNTTEVNERYVFEHVTDFSDYVVTPKSIDDLPWRHVENDATEDSTTETTTPKATTTKTTTTKATTTKTTTTKATTTTTKRPYPVISKVYRDTTDSYISNAYINITTDINKNISYITLSNGLVMALNINFYYFASDDPMRMGRPEYKKPGAYVFRPMDPEPVFISRKPKTKVYKTGVVDEIHSDSNFASYIVRLYKNAPYVEVQWILRGIPVSDGIGKEVFIRYSTDLETNGVFYTDANGRQTVKRVFGHRPLYTPIAPDAVAGNYFPVTSKITLEDPLRLIRFSVLNDRTQGGSSFNGEIDIMLNRRILTDDAGFQAFMNETENNIGTTITGKHYIYITKLTTKINKIYEKKLAKEISLQPQIFLPTQTVQKSDWAKFKNEFFGVKKLPIGLNVLTLQEWNDHSYLIRIENYLEKSDIVKSGIKKLILKDLFTIFRIVKVKETTLAGNIFKEDHVPISWRKETGNTEDLEPFKEVKVDEEILFKPQQIRTFVIWVKFY